MCGSLWMRRQGCRPCMVCSGMKNESTQVHILVHAQGHWTEKREAASIDRPMSLRILLYALYEWWMYYLINKWKLALQVIVRTKEHVQSLGLGRACTVDSPYLPLCLSTQTELDPWLVYSCLNWHAWCTSAGVCTGGHRTRNVGSGFCPWGAVTCPRTVVAVSCLIWNEAFHCACHPNST